MRNLSAIIIFGVLLLIVAVATVFQIKLGDSANLGMFIVTAMAALGTCGVTILSVFPFTHKDRLEAILCKRKGKLYIMIYSKCNHTVYLGYDKYHTAEYVDAYALWWATSGEKTEYNSKHLYVQPGDNMAVPPRGIIGYKINPKVFRNHDINKITIQIMTSNGYRIPVKNQLNKKVRIAKKTNLWYNIKRKMGEFFNTFI